jgi:hypothetical protein
MGCFHAAAPNRLPGPRRCSPDCRSQPQPAVGGVIADVQAGQFGSDGFATMVGRVAAIEQALGIYDLAQFTPPKITPSAA